MSHPLHHAISSKKNWGGKVEDYLPIHNWFDETKAAFADHRHRAIRHHAEGIFWCESVFGVYITNSDGKMVPVRAVAEQHVREDLGVIPSIKDWLINLATKGWMLRPGEGRKKLQEIHKDKLDYQSIQIKENEQ